MYTWASDRVGSEINGFKILDVKRENNRTLALAECPFCHEAKWMRLDSLDTKASCGCFRKNAANLTGQYFGRLKALYPTSKRRKSNGTIIWVCECECGNKVEVSTQDLIRNGVRSCGCLAKETAHSNGIRVGKIIAEQYCIDNTNINRLYAHMPQNNTSGIKGVHWDKKRHKWCAQIVFKGKHYSLGRYDKKEDAIEVRKIAEKNLHENFVEWYAEKYPEQWKRIKNKKEQQ